MTHSEWLEIAADVCDMWPNQPWPDATIAAYFADVQDLSAEQVRVAARALLRDGREFPPTAGILRQKVTELALDVPDWGEVRLHMGRLVSSGMLGTAYEGHAGNATRLNRALAATPPAVAEFVRHVGPRQLADGFSEEGDDEARLRRKWEVFVARALRDASYVGLPSAELPGIERAHKRNPAPVPFARALRAAAEDAA